MALDRRFHMQVSMQNKGTRQGSSDQRLGRMQNVSRFKMSRQGGLVPIMSSEDYSVSADRTRMVLVRKSCSQQQKLSFNRRAVRAVADKVVEQI